MKRVSYFTVIFIVSTIFFIGKNTNAQDVDTLSTVVITTEKKIADVKQKFVGFQNIVNIERKYLKANLDKNIEEILNRYSGIFVRDYGVNSIAVMNIRGTSPAQNLVMWEGVPMNNVASGVGDLSQLSSNNFNSFQVITGSQGSLFGTGAMGGVVSLNNGMASGFNNNTAINYGSFNNFSVNTNTTYATKYFNYLANLSFNNSKNDFTFLKNGKKLSIDNAHKKTYSAIVAIDRSFSISKNDSMIVRIDGWLQENERGIPPALFESFSTKQIREKWMRGVLSFRYFPHKYDGTEWYLRLSKFQDKYHYNDSLSFTSLSYIQSQWYNEVGFRKAKNYGNYAHEFLVFLPTQFQKIFNESSSHVQRMIGVSGHYHSSFYKDKIIFIANLRQEIIDRKLSPLVYGASISWAFLNKSDIIKNEYHKALLTFQYQKAYRIPTLNEKYIFPGGNINLKPELSHNFEFTAMYDGKNLFNTKINSSYKISYFNRKINDWIYWLGGSIWTPYNISQVFSRGWDHQFKVNTVINKIQYYFQSDFSYTIATTQSFIGNNATIGKQIAYTPRYLWRNNVGIISKLFSFNLSHSYTGYRFYNLDESGILFPFNLWHAYMTYNVLNKNNSSITGKFSIDNIFNTSYQVANGRPMPLRSYNLGIIFNIHY